MTACRQPTVRRSTRARPLALATLFALGWSWSATISAGLLDNIQARSLEGVTEYQLDFSVPVGYVRHFPPDQGKRIKLYLWSEALTHSEPIETTTYKPRYTPAREIPFSVQYTTARPCFATRDEVLDNRSICLDIEFKESVRYRIRPGTDGRSILITVLPGPGASAPNPKK
jgi:hypothetical protein